MFSDRLAPEFSLFDYIRTDEMGISTCIASLLDPKGKHGQGDVFLNEFIKSTASVSNWATTSEHCQIFTEKQANDQRRIDIFLKFDNGFIGIENKPWANDQKDQLRDYANFLKRTSNGGNWLLIYLCNRDPSENTINDGLLKEISLSGNFIRLNYDEIIDWLWCCYSAARSQTVRVFIEEFAKFIKSNINGELDMSESNEIISTILKSPENIESSFHVYQAIGSLKRRLLENFKQDLIGELRKNNHEIVWEDSLYESKRYSGFGVKLSNSQDKHLRFEFDRSELNSFLWGIKRDSESVKYAHETWLEINKLMSDKKWTGKSSEYWPWYSEASDRQFNNDFKDWSISSKPWIGMANGSLAKDIASLANEIYSLIESKDHLKLFMPIT